MRLRDILSPIEFDVFNCEYLEKKPLHISRLNRAFYGSLFSVEDFNILVNLPHRDSASLKIVKDGKFVENSFYSSETVSQSYSSVDPSTVRNLFNQGYTLVFDDIATIRQSLSDLVEEISSLMQCRTSVNAFFSPCKSSQGFRIHTDSTDVFVLHIEGEKEWQFFTPPSSLSKKILDCTDSLEHVDTFVARPGDLLYIPRGYPHKAISNSRSCHISICIDRFTLADFLHEVLDVASDQNVELRRHFNFRGDISSKTSVISSLLEAILDESNLYDAENRLFHRLISFKKGKQFTNLLQPKKKRDENQAIRVKPYSLMKVLKTSRSCKLFWKGEEITLPSKAWPIFERLEGGGWIYSSELNFPQTSSKEIESLISYLLEIDLLEQDDV